MAPSVLYVDDDDANLTVFEATCAGEFPCLTASSGAAALELMRRTEVGVLLTDQRMPGMSGVELAERAHAEFPETVRMLVTAFSDLSAAIDAINRGHIRRYLRKPWDARELKAALREALDLYSTTARLRELERRLVATERVYALGVVAASIGHELKNPLAWLTTNLGELKAAFADLSGALAGRPDPELLRAQVGEMEELLADAIEGAAQIAGVQQSIEVSTRRSAGSTAVDLADVVRLTLRSVQTELRRRGHLELDTHPVPEVRGSRTRLGQVVLNLLVNALEALPERPRAENRVRLVLAADGATVRLSVEDNGVGVSDDALPHLFDPFFTTKEKSGTGLGLAISKQIVTEMGGTIEVERVQGAGLRFTVVLPALAE